MTHSFPRNMSKAQAGLAVWIALLLGGCVLAPGQMKQEQAKLQKVGQRYEPPVEKRPLPELSETPTWQEVLRRAFYANGDLESAYFEWKAAMARVAMAASYPNSNVQVGFDYMFSAEKMKSWNRTTISAGFDPSMTLRLPQKVQAAGRVAFEQARAAGMRFEAVKFDLQRKVLQAWFDYALMAEKVRIERENLDLLKMLTEQAGNRVRAGAPQQDLLKAQIEQRLAENQVASMESELTQMRAMLNGMLARPAEAPLAPPKAFPTSRVVGADDAQLLAAAVDKNPELGGLARDVAGRQNALEVAKLAYIPDFSPSFSFTGSVSQAVGAMIMLPTNLPMIEGQIKEARAMLRSSEAMLRQTKADRAASFVANLVAMRNAERQAAIFSDVILPKARQSLDSSRQAYAAGQVSFVELVDAQRTLLEIRRVLADVRALREKRLADVEALAGVDVETLAAAPSSAPTTRAATMTSAPASQPASQPTTTSATSSRPAERTAVPALDVEYVCPMHPQIVRREPGRCPICNMPLAIKRIGHDQAASQAASQPASEPASQPTSQPQTHEVPHHEH